MDYYADVLDHTGRTPREFGAIHLHVESVTRGPLGDAVAVLWLQSAFEPPASSGHSVQVMGRQKQGPMQRMLGQFPLPSLEGGRVVRWRLPFSLPPEIDELQHLRTKSAAEAASFDVERAFTLFLSALWVGAGRTARGEVLSGSSFIKQHALGHLLRILTNCPSTGSETQLDNLDPFRRFEREFPEQPGRCRS